MDAPGHLPPYPPERDRWSFPPPRVGRRWLLAAVAASLLAVLVAAAAVAVVVEADSRDARGVIDGELAGDVVQRECSLMRSTVEGLPASGPARRRAEVLADQNTAIRQMVERIGELPQRIRDADRPLDAWLGDWRTLLAARERWARAVADGFTGDFAVPRDADGEPVVQRMDAAGEEVCRVPDAVLDPYGVEDLTV